jgi:kynurenine formamidase
MIGDTHIFDLEQPRTAEMPIHPAHQQAGYSYLLHRHHEDEYRPEEAGPRAGAAGVIICGEHTGTHIDALCHQSDALVLYGGVPVNGEIQSSRGFARLGAEEIPPIVAPGVLLDVAAVEGVESLEPGHAVTGEDLEECCEKQGVSIEPGDVVLVRTGNDRYWDDPERYLAGPGMDSSASYWVAERRVLAVGADNAAWDVPGLKDPELRCMLPGHLILLTRYGIYIIENLKLDELAAAGHHRFRFVCAPLKLVGATGSPVCPLAIVDGTRTDS